jgi:hypothetical protein
MNKKLVSLGLVTAAAFAFLAAPVSALAGHGKAEVKCIGVKSAKAKDGVIMVKSKKACIKKGGTVADDKSSTTTSTTPSTSPSTDTTTTPSTQTPTTDTTTPPQ